MYEAQKVLRGPKLLLSDQASGAKVSHQNPMSSEVIKLSTAKKNFKKSLAVTILVPAIQDGGFKKCCMLGGQYDGSERHYFFREEKTQGSRRTAALLAVAYFSRRLISLRLSLFLFFRVANQFPQFRRGVGHVDMIDA